MASLQSISLPVKLHSSVISKEFISGKLNLRWSGNNPSLLPVHCQLQPDGSNKRASTGATESQPAGPSSLFYLSRRDALLAAACSSVTLAGALDAPAFAKSLQSIGVGSYLPKANEGDFVVFSPDEKSTPAMRAGNVAPYSFWLPPTWTQSRIANIQSGNYCQPKCAEPWIEVKFEDPRQGTVQMVASPMVRLTNRANQTIEEIGSPERIISALGSFVTGDSFDSDELVETSIRKVDDQTYYSYVLETPYARSGTHNMAAATAKGNTVLLLVVSATDSQWAENKEKLRKVLDSFSV